MANIITKRASLGKTRLEQEQNLRKEGMSTLNDGEMAKLKYAERRAKDESGSTKNFFTGQDLLKIK